MPVVFSICLYVCMVMYCLIIFNTFEYVYTCLRIDLLLVGSITPLPLIPTAPLSCGGGQTGGLPSCLALTFIKKKTPSLRRLGETKKTLHITFEYV